MRRFLFCTLWFVVIFIVLTLVTSAIGSEIACPGSEVTDEAIACAHSTGVAFGDKYGMLLVLASAALSLAGTFLGLLPGTKKRS